MSEQKKVLEMLVKPDDKSGLNVLLSSEKPSHSGNFSAAVWVQVGGTYEPNYCCRFADVLLFDLCKFMRDICSGSLTTELAPSFIRGVSPKHFVR
jgi:hypothetical protein